METTFKIKLEKNDNSKGNNRLICNYNINLNEYYIQNICRVTIAFFYKVVKT